MLLPACQSSPSRWSQPGPTTRPRTSVPGSSSGPFGFRRGTLAVGLRARLRGGRGGGRRSASSASSAMRISRVPRALRQELGWIVLKAVAKERDRRYDSPAALSEDLRRYLAD